MIILASDCFRPDRKKYAAALGLLKRMGLCDAHCLAHSNNTSYTQWAMGYEVLDASQLRQITDQLPKERVLVIGFEMSPGICMFLAQVGVDYINLSFHPVRFCEDLYFLVRTSLQKLDDFRFDISAEITKSVERITETSEAQGGGRIKIRYKNIVIEQLPLDASTIEGGRFLGVSDVVKKFRLEKFHVLRHPFGNYKYRNELNDSAYHIMSTHKEIQFFGVSSSLLHEAEYFQVPAQRMLDHSSRMANSMDSSISINGLASAFDFLGIKHTIDNVFSLREFSGADWKRKK